MTATSRMPRISHTSTSTPRSLAMEMRPRKAPRVPPRIPAIMTNSACSILEAASITAPTRDGYGRLLQVFLLEEGLANLDMHSHKLDELLVARFDLLFLEGRHSSAGQKLLASVLFWYPIQSGRGKPKLPRAVRALKGWGRQCPAKTRTPLPFFLVCALAMQMLTMRHPVMALYWIMMTDTYLRPSECLRMKCSQVIPPQPGRGMARVAIIINPGYALQPSKTGELDESLHITRPWVARLILQHHRCRLRAGYQHLWPFDLGAVRKVFMAAVQALGVGHLSPVLYSARHSGASTDRLEDRLTLLEVQRRGRWRCDSSVRRYEKRAIIQQAAASLPRAMKAQCLRDMEKLPAALARALQ